MTYDDLVDRITLAQADGVPTVIEADEIRDLLTIGNGFEAGGCWSALGELRLTEASRAGTLTLRGWPAVINGAAR